MTDVHARKVIRIEGHRSANMASDFWEVCVSLVDFSEDSNTGFRNDVQTLL